MNRPKRFWKWGLYLVSSILIISALLHGVGYTSVLQAMEKAGMPPSWAAGIKALWLTFSVHLLIVAAIFMVAAARPAMVDSRILAVCGLFPAIDTMLLLGSVGIFAGSILLGLAALVIYAVLALKSRK